MQRCCTWVAWSYVRMVGGRKVLWGISVVPLFCTAQRGIIFTVFLVNEGSEITAPCEIHLGLADPLRHILGNTHPGEQDQPQALRTRPSFSREILGLASYRASRESETSKDYGLWTMAVSVARFELMAKAHLNQSPPSSSHYWLNLVPSMKILMLKIEVEEWLRGTVV